MVPNLDSHKDHMGSLKTQLHDPESLGVEPFFKKTNKQKQIEQNKNKEREPSPDIMYLWLKGFLNPLSNTYFPHCFREEWESMCKLTT